MANSNPVLPEGWAGSTHLDPTIRSYRDLVLRSKSFLGYPVHDDELPASTWAMIIDNACEIYQAWEGSRKEEYLVFCADLYQPGCGVKLDELIQVGCNKNRCEQTTIVETITSYQITCDPIETRTAYLSVTPFVYPYDVKYATRFEDIKPEFTGVQGQNIHIFFDPKNPWKASNVCAANCVNIAPVSSQWYQLSGNHCLSATVFDFVNDSTLTSYISAISSTIVDYPLSAVPLSSMGVSLTAIPITHYPLECFYPANENIGPPLQACINIGGGLGYVTPSCGPLNYCEPLSAQFNISPSWNYILTAINLTSTCVATSSIQVHNVSSYFQQYCQCNGITLVSSINYTASAYCYDLYKAVLSGSDGLIVPVSALDISKASHVKLWDIPSCTNDGSIPLDYNDGVKSTFTVCNSAFSTSGPMLLEHVQFFKDYKPPLEALDWYCGINNNGFTMSFYNSAYGECIRHTPEKVKVDVTFCKQQTTTQVGQVSTVHYSSYDEGLGQTRKVLGVYSVDPPSGGYYGGSSDLLFNFDYAIMAGAFGYDISSGTRSTMLKQSGYDLVTYHLAKSFVEQTRKMLRYTSYTYDPYTQRLKIIPEPTGSYRGGSAIGDDSSCCAVRSNQCYMVGVYLSPTVEEMLSTYWVQEYVLAKAKTIIGTMRSKYGNNRLGDGTTIDGSAMLAEGNERIKELMKELRDDLYYNSGPLYYIG